MRPTDRLLVKSLKAQVRPEVAAAGRRVVARDRDVLDYLAAYDQGRETEPQPDGDAESRRTIPAG